MPYTTWTKPKVRTQDFSPHRNPNHAAADSYRRQIAERERFGHGAEGDGAIQHWKYRRPRGPNRHLVEHPKDPSRTIEVPATSSNAAFVAGQYVAVATDRSGSVIIGSPAPGRKGSSGFATDGVSRVDDAIGITSVTPPTIPQGSTIDLEVIGFGFEDNEFFSPVKYDETLLTDVAAPLLTINTQTFVDEVTYTINVTCSLEAPVGYQFDLNVERGSSS